MARKTPANLSVSRKNLVELTGFRPLTKSELKKLGYSEGARRYTSQKEGVKKLRKEATQSRRYVEELYLSSINNGRKVRLEVRAEELFEKRGLRSPRDRYNRLREAYITSRFQGPVGYKETKSGILKPLLPTDARKITLTADKEFKALYKAATNRSQTPKAKKARLEALRVLYPANASDWNELIQKYIQT